MELLIIQIFDSENPDTGEACITGATDPDEYALRKCIAYDAIE